MTFKFFAAPSGEITATVQCSDATLNVIPTNLACDSWVSVDKHYYDWVEGAIKLKGTPPPGPFTFDFATKQWVDSRTLEQMQALAWENMKSLRSQKEAAGFSWDGSVFDSDQVSQSRITGAVLLAMMNPNFETTWILRDNSTRTLSASDILAVGAALGAHIAPIFPRSQELRLEIYAAATIAAVEAITWDAP